MNRFTIFPAAMLALGLASCGDANHALTTDNTTSERVERDAVRSGQEARDAVRDGAQDFKEMTVEESKPFERRASDLVDEAGNKIQDGANTTSDKAREAYEASKDKTGSAWGSIKEKTGNAWDATKEKTNDAWEATKETSGNAWEATKDAAGNTRDTVRDGATDTYNRANQAIEGGHENSRLSLWSHQHANGHHKQTPEEWEAHKERARQNVQGVADSARDSVDDTADRAARVADGMTMEAEDSFQRAGDAARRTVNDAGEAISDAYQGTKENVEEGVDNAADATVGAVQWSRDAVRNGAQWTADTARNGAQWTQDRVRGGRQAVGESLRRVGHATDRAVDSTKDAVVGTYSDLSQRGQQVAQASRQETAQLDQEAAVQAAEQATADENNGMAERGRALAAEYGNDVNTDPAATPVAASTVLRTSQAEGVRRIAAAICESMNMRRPFGSAALKYNTMDDCLANEQGVYGHKYFGSETCVTNGFRNDRLDYCVNVAHNSYSTYSLPKGLEWFWNCDSEFVCEAP